MSVPSCVSYVQYVRALSAVNGKALDDYQGVAKILVDLHREHTATAKLNGESGGGGGHCGRAEAHVAENGGVRGDVDVDALAARVAEALHISGGAEVLFAAKSSAKPMTAERMKEMVCGRCGKKGHIKRDCKERCKKCGMQSCGGVKAGPYKCVVLNGIPPRLTKIMPPAIKASIIARAKEMGAKWVTKGAAGKLEPADDRDDGLVLTAKDGVINPIVEI